MTTPTMDPETCREWACAIGDDLVARRDEPSSPRLGDGDAGVALFLAYLGAATGEARYSDAAEARLERAANAPADPDPCLFSGVAGIAWVHEHVCGRLLAPNVDDVNAETDELVDAILASPERWINRWEHTLGLVGVGVYVLERPVVAARADRLARVVDILEHVAEHATDGIRWRSSLDSNGRSLGMAHGAAGVIAFLSRLLREDAVGDRGRIERLLRASVRAVMRAKLPGDGGYPMFADEPTPCRVAWCHGDLGVAVALDAAGSALGDASVRHEAVDAATRCARRDLRASQVRDCGFCHGSIGVSHIFRRLFERTAVAALADAADRWLAHVASERRPGDGVGGVRSWGRLEGAWQVDPGLLQGAAGVGLGLLTAGGLIDASWDRVFALS